MPTRLAAAVLCLGLLFPHSALALRSEQTEDNPVAAAGLEQALQASSAAGLEEGDREALAAESSSGRPDAGASDSNAGLEQAGRVSRRTFLVGAPAQAAAAAVAAGQSQSAAPAPPALDPEKMSEIFRVRQSLKELCERLVQASLPLRSLGYSPVAELLRTRDQLLELERSARPEYAPFFESAKEAERALRTRLTEVRAQKSGDDSSTPIRAEGYGIALDQGQQAYDLWETVRSVTWGLSQTLQEPMDFLGEYRRAVEARMTPDQFVADAAVRFIVPRADTVEAMKRLREDEGLKEPDPARLQEQAAGYVETIRGLALSYGLRLWPERSGEGLGASRHSLWFFWNTLVHDRIASARQAFRQRLKEKLQRRFGEDAEINDAPINTDDSRPFSKWRRAVARQSVGRSRRNRFAKLLPPHLRAEGLSDSEVEVEVNRVRGADPSDLRKGPQAYAEQVAERRRQAEQAKQAPPPPPPVGAMQMLSERLSQATAQSPARLLLVTDADGRFRFVGWKRQTTDPAQAAQPDVGQWSALGGERLSGLDGWGRGRRQRNRVYRIQIPAGLPAPMLKTLLERASWWEAAPLPSAESYDLSKEMPIFLPQPTVASAEAAGLEQGDREALAAEWADYVVSVEARLAEVHGEENWRILGGWFQGDFDKARWGMGDVKEQPSALRRMALNLWTSLRDPWSAHRLWRYYESLARAYTALGDNLRDVQKAIRSGHLGKASWRAGMAAFWARLLAWPVESSANWVHLERREAMWAVEHGGMIPYELLLERLSDELEEWGARLAALAEESSGARPGAGASDANAGLEELRARWDALPAPASRVQRGEVHVVDPGLALGFGRFLAKVQPDPVVAIAGGLEEERALLRSGFGGEGRLILQADSFGGLEEARSAAAALYPGLSPRFYRQQEQGKLPAWLAGILERYDVQGTGLEEAMGMVEALSVERAA